MYGYGKLTLRASKVDGWHVGTQTLASELTCRPTKLNMEITRGLVE